MLVQPFAKQQVLVYQSLCCVSMSVMNQQVQQQAQQVVANMAFDAWLGRTYEWSLATRCQCCAVLAHLCCLQCRCCWCLSVAFVQH